MATRTRPGRRAQQREELVADIKAAALAQIADGGATAVSWRGIAAEVGMNPASLYTYFPSLHDLYTALIADGFGALGAELADAVRTAGPDRSDRALAWARAYRLWARRHPSWFNLCFTDVLPGYEAPPGGPTVEAQRSMFEPLLGDLPSSPDGPDLTTGVAFWAAVHGATTLEVNHHVHSGWADVDGTFERTVEVAVGALG